MSSWFFENEEEQTQLRERSQLRNSIKLQIFTLKTMKFDIWHVQNYKYSTEHTVYSTVQ